MDRLNLRNDFGFSAADREHRLVFEGTPENNPPPPPRVEQGNLNDFNRLHQGAEANGNTAERTYNNVYDRMTKRQEAYRNEVTALSDYIRKAGGNLDTNTQGTRANVTRLIDDLQNVYQQTYVDRNGQRREYREGLYARVNDVERAYVQIEGMIGTIEDAVATSNGGQLPVGITRYADRVRAERTRAALAGEGNGSVDIRTYSVPFARESMSETSTYSLLRVPANFTFNWGANPEVAGIVSGKFDIQSGMSNGIQYLRILPAAATALAARGLSVPVTVTGIGGRVEGTTTATFRADGPINENPNVGNTLIRIEYGRLTGQNGEPVNPDGGVDTIPVETPEQIEAKNETARKEFHARWTTLNEVSENARIVFTDSDGTSSTAELLVRAQAELDGLRDERSHLELRGALPPPANGENPNVKTYEDRAAAIPGREQEVRDRLEQLQAYASFTETATTLAQASDNALNLVSPTIPAENDAEGWKLLLDQLKDVHSTATAESVHLGTFEEGNPTPHSGANENQRQEVANRTEEITKRISELEPQLQSAQESLYEAERQQFDEKWKKLKEESDRTRDGYDEFDGTDDTDEKISRLTAHVTALKNESDALKEVQDLHDTKEGGDDRFTVWHDRSTELGGDGGLLDRMEQRLEQYKAYKEFADLAARESEVTQLMESNIPTNDPASNDVQGWEDMVFACKAYEEQLGYEKTHLDTFTEGSIAYAGATESQREDIDEDLQFVIGEQCEMFGVEIPRVEEGLREAKRQKFDEDWKELQSESNSTASWEDGDPENTEEKIGLLQKHVDALTKERDFLEGRTELEDTKDGGDDRFDAWNSRYDDVNGDGKLLNVAEEQLEAFKAFKEFRDNADTYEGESIADLENMPADPTDAAAVAEWQTKADACDRYLNTRLKPEQDNLNTFADSNAETGATDTQKKTVADRKGVVAGEITRMEAELPRVQEALKNAQRLIFDREAVRLQGETTGAETLRTVATGHDDFNSEIVTAQQYLDAIDAELKHLKEEGDMKYPPTDPPDGAMMRYDERIQTLNKTRETVVQEKSISEGLKAFQERRTERSEATAKVRGAAEAVRDQTPPEGDIVNWRDKVQKLEAYAKALNDEGANIRTLPFGGSDAYRTEVTGRGNEILKIIEDLSKPLEEARKNVESANNITQLRNERISQRNPTTRMNINRYETIRVEKQGRGGTTQEVAQFANLDVAGFPKITRNDTTHEVVIDRNNITDGTYKITVGARDCTITIGRGTRRS